MEYGEYVEHEIILLDNLTWSMRNKYMYYTNTDNKPVIRFSMVNNQLQYEYFDFSDNTWKLGGVLTPINPGSSRFPSTGSSYLLVEPTAINAYLADQLQLLLTADSLNVENKPILGLVASDDPHSAVTLEQL